MNEINIMKNKIKSEHLTNKENQNKIQGQFEEKECIVPTFGFINNGNICYFNSLLQNILNCKYIMYYLINEQVPKNDFQMYFKNKFIQFIKLYNIREDNVSNNLENNIFEKEVSTFSYNLLNLLLKKYKNINVNEQQSSSEFFLYIIEELGIEHFFKIRHIINIHCNNCKNISSKVDECYHFEMFCDNKSQIDIDDFLYSVNIINEYKCDKCKTVSRALYEKKAENISKYFVILLNKYYNKVDINYPNSFEIVIKNICDVSSQEPNIPTKCVWKNIGQIEHIGHLNSGHYIALCKRFDRVFLFDDLSVKLVDNSDDCNLRSSKNTYMIFYEKK
jgi:ubiquitin C-terminal hydrolase